MQCGVQIVLDSKTRIPRLEDFDEPLERFKKIATEAGMHLRELLVVKPEIPGSTSDGEFCVLAVGWEWSDLESLPL